MIPALAPYPEYRPSLLPGLGAIPAHWEERRAKYLYREVDERSTTGKEELCSVSHKTGVTPRKANVTMFMAESTVGYKICRPDDVVVNTLWAWMAALGVAGQVGVVSPAYGVYRPRAGSSLSPAFANQVLRTEPYKREYLARSTGVNASRLRLYPEDFLCIPILLPPSDEQAAIVRLVRLFDNRVNRIIGAKRRLIDALTEQKQAIISRAVTHGLTRCTSFKPCGIAFDIPVHWEVSRVKNEMRCLNTKRVPLSGTERGTMTSRLYDYYGASGVIDKVDNYLFDDDLLLIAEDGANLVLRNLPLAIIARGKFWVNNHAHILKPKRGCLEYFAAVLEAIDYAPWITGAAQPKLTQDRLMAVHIPAPPVNEQHEIMAAVEKQTRELVNAIERVRQEIELVREYRARLVTDIVTGQVDVRGIAVSETAVPGGDPQVDLEDAAEASPESDDFIDTPTEEVEV